MKKHRWVPHWVQSLGNCANGMFVVDGHQRILTWNQGAERLLGYASREVVGRRCYEVVCSRSRSGETYCQAACAVVRQTGAGPWPPDFDLSTTAKDGSTVWLSVSVARIGTETDGLTLHMLRPVRHRDRAAAGASHLAVPRSMSPRERDVVTLLAEGASTRDVARKLRLSEATVRTHVRNMLRKTKTHTRAQLVALMTRK